MTIELITPEEHAKLLEIYNESPKLSFQNKGYEYINKSTLSEKDLENHKIVTEILRKSIKRFSEFNNFLIGKDGAIVIRVQYGYDESFTGVGYLGVDELLNGFKDGIKEC